MVTARLTPLRLMRKALRHERKSPADPAGQRPTDLNLRLLPVLLDARRAQAGEAVLVDGILPGEEFLDGQRVAAAGFLERKEPAAHGGDDLGLAPDDPALGAGRGQIGNRQRAAVRSDHVFRPW